MQKIGLFIESFHIGGVQKVFITLANEFVHQGYNVTIITLNAEGELKESVDDSVEVLDLQNRHIKSVFFKVARLIKQKELDFLLIGKDLENLFFILNKIVFKYKAKLFISQHNYLLPENRCAQKSYRKIIVNAMKVLYRYADGIICVSNGIKEALKQSGIPSKKLRVIYNPLNLETIYSMSNDVRCLKYTPYVVYCGRLSPIKNLEYLIRSFSRFVNYRVGYKLLLVGDGAERVKLEALAQHEGILENVIFIGAVSNPYMYIKHADILVLTSIKEAFSMVVLEAMALGKTVVSTSSGGPNEIIQSDKGYIVYSLDDAQKFADKMLYAIDHPVSSWELIGFTKLFSVQKIAKEYIEYFKSNI